MAWSLWRINVNNIIVIVIARGRCSRWGQPTSVLCTENKHYNSFYNKYNLKTIIVWSHRVSVMQFFVSWLH